MTVSAAVSTIVAEQGATGTIMQYWDWTIANIEMLTTIVLALNVFMCALNWKINWPIGLVGVTMYGLSSWFLWGLYADATLQIFYFLTGLYGWWYWCKGGEGKTEAKITDLNFLSWVGVAALVAAGTYFVGFFLDIKTDSVVPYLDAYTTVICLFAQILLMLRVRSAWLLWVAANVVYVYMFHLKGLEMLSLLYVAFIFNAAFGFINWTRIKKKESCSVQK